MSIADRRRRSEADPGVSLRRYPLFPALSPARRSYPDRTFASLISHLLQAALLQARYSNFNHDCVMDTLILTSRSRPLSSSRRRHRFAQTTN